ncbi:hypothetical protein INT47_011694 [Mucor saturninus]|uniref:Mannosyltransferase n=1 Tax=Mucor saturninus TaxID=64648 RepID=A0A8H7V1E9_9FUNG|nr:hypothetical protein INT47_011694 [Mucor saturninus]
MTLAIQQRSTPSSQIFIFGLCLCFRFFNAYLTRTYDNPDEYWQGQEVAHHMVFGYGYLTWEWREKIRSFAHPMTLGLIYKLIQMAGLEHTQLLVAAPRYFQATLAAWADMCTFTLAKKIFGNSIALPMLFTTLCSWFNFLMAARTLSNSMEMVFTIVALNYWPLPGVVNFGERSWLKRYRISLVLASIACVMRPTNGLIWLFLGLDLIRAAKNNRIKVIFNAGITCSLILLANAVLDTRLYNTSWDFDQLIFTPFLFFKVNVVNNISLFYGVHTWHWYLSQGIPVIFTTFLPLLAYGSWCIYNDKTVYPRCKSLLYLSLWVIIIYSLLPHKEFRFLFPLVPILLMVAAFGLQRTGTRWRKRILCFLVLTQMPLALYLSLWHQRGVMDVMLWLRTQPMKSLGVLMPCHSTPWASVLHQDLPMWFLTCEPPLNETSVDEADMFYKDPVAYLDRLNDWPSHLVMFEQLHLDEYLEAKGYKECNRFFNSHFHDDARRKGDVLVMC